MSQKQVHMCEGCGRQCENYYAERMWIHVIGSISRALGVMGKSSYEADYLDDGDHDFCSLGCLELALVKIRKDPKRS